MPPKVAPIPARLFEGVNINQYRLSAAINEGFASSRDPKLTGLRVNSKGVCHGDSILRILFGEGYLHIKKRILSATAEERTRLGTSVWRDVQRIMGLPILQDPSLPLQGVSFLNQRQSDGLKYSGRDILAEYTVYLNRRILENLLASLMEANEPCEMSFSLFGHAITVIYKEGSIHVYDPNNTYGDDIYNTPRGAAEKITEIYIKMCRDQLPRIVPKNIPFFAHIAIFKDTKKDIKLKTFIAKLARTESYSLGKKNYFGENLIYHLLLKGNMKNIPTFTEQQYIDLFFDGINKNYDGVVSKFLKTISIDTYIDLLENENFSDIINSDDEYSLDQFKKLLEYYGYYSKKVNFDPEKQLSAAILYLAVKKFNISLSKIAENLFYLHKDYRALSWIVDEEGLSSIAANSHIEVHNRMIVERDLVSRFGESSLIDSFNSQDFSRLHILLLLFYFTGNQQSFLDFCNKVLDDVTLPVGEKYLLTLRVISILKETFSFSIIENKPEWIKVIVNLLVKTNSFDHELAFLNIVKYERQEHFDLLYRYFDLSPRLGVKLVFEAIENCSIGFFNFLLERFNNKGYLSYVLNGLNGAVETALHIAAYKGKVEHVRRLLVLGCTQTISSRMETPLYIACAMGHKEIARLLIMASNNVQFIMTDAMTIFDAAKNSLASDMHDELMKIFFEKNTVDELCIRMPSPYRELFVEYHNRKAPVTLEAQIAHSNLSVLAEMAEAFSSGLLTPEFSESDDFDPSIYFTKDILSNDSDNMMDLDVNEHFNLTEIAQATMLPPSPLMRNLPSAALVRAS